MIKTILAIAAGITLAGSALAGPSIDRINETGNVNIGSRANSIPYSKITSRGVAEGYSTDICKVIIKEIESKLGKTLAMTMQEVDGKTRQPLVMNGTTQLECGSTSYTEERAKVVNFMIVDADPVIPATLANNNSIKSLDDFKGKRVSVVAGTTAEKIFKKLNAEKGWGTTIVLAKDYPEAFLQVEQGRTDAVSTNGVLLAGEISKLNNGKFKLLPKVIVGEAELIGIMYPKNDPELERMVKVVEARIKKDGTLERLYSKWFTPLGLKWTDEQRKAVLGN
ncbi:transporter substrate-binding domain-containing protein [Diaphorobacter aerolatus]|uniref:Transporter substrate-binding domain-containing protein n=1 Tax=Diaphorobacter aerolatus TaxID=1288495 RepID=A0A7H0GJ96_9BURK|nr:transporter substrate-binding domain-containing protein [Diaphorobacter aerolatus]QNP48362.1 transporter substrate-binding domain-containing protein [Diaphorobacter aerolatus]